MMIDYQLAQLIKEPTRVNAKSQTLMAVFIDIERRSRIYTKNCTDHFLRTFQEPHMIFKDHLQWGSQVVQKFTFPVHFKRALKLELFAPPTFLHFSVRLS